ncbi:MAG: hypothetical protein HY591_05335 [Candidatus Omnitrophica bacterium]|nr:hypothetical protein [Candidatus Omnitrophota bacterium]
MRIYRLDKTIVRAQGNAERFLNGLTSNSLDKPHNAFLNLHGRIIATFDQVRGGEDGFLLAIAPCAWGPLKAHADKYARLNKTMFEPVDLNAYFDLDGNAPAREGDFTIPQNAGRMILTSRILTQTVSNDESDLFRLKHGIPLQGADYTDEMVLNVHEYDFVSYTKGCFLGQEPVAKVHNRSKPTWKLSVCHADELSPEEQETMTSKTVDPETGRTKGFVFIKNA